MQSNPHKLTVIDGETLMDKRLPPTKFCVNTLYANAWGKSLHCIINRTTLRFKTPQGDISSDNIDSIRISHHWSYDELHITMADGSIKTITLENAKIQVSDNGRISTYALCKLDYIELGRTLNR